MILEQGELLLAGPKNSEARSSEHSELAMGNLLAAEAGRAASSDELTRTLAVG